jgi:Tol biopolymer transport system component
MEGKATATRPDPISPDGRYLAYSTYDAPFTAPFGGVSVDVASRGSTLAVVPFPGGGEARQLLRMSAPQSLSWWTWLPDSSGLVVSKVMRESGGQRSELWLVPFTGQPRKMDIDISHWIDPPGGDTFFVPHPDGRQIVYVGAAGKAGAEVWAIENFLPALAAKR